MTYLIIFKEDKDRQLILDNVDRIECTKEDVKFYRKNNVCAYFRLDEIAGFYESLPQ